MRIKIFSCCLAAAVGLTTFSCKDDLTMSVDDSHKGSITDDGRGVYMSLGVNFSDGIGGTRSSTNTPDNEEDYVTSTGGMEYSSLEEYDVRTAIIVLAEMDNHNYLAHADVTGILTGNRETQSAAPNENGNKIDPANYYSFSTKGRFKYSDIAALYDEESGELLDKYKKGINVFVFCNPTADLLDRFETIGEAGTHTNEWVNWQGTVEQAPLLPGYTPSVTNSIWASRSFLMSNAKPAFAELPQYLSNWDFYNMDDPFDLSGKNDKYNDGADPDNSEEGGLSRGNSRGPVYVERAVARIDLKANKDHNKGLHTDWINDPDADWRYQILGGLSSSIHDGTIDVEGDEASSNFNFVDVKLTRLSLVNMSKNFNFLRRVSPDGMPLNATVMGVERVSNYVVDTDAATKQQLEGYNVSNASDGFNFALFTDAEGSMDTNLSREYAYDRNSWYSANIMDIMGSEKKDNLNEYTIWRYVTENTIPQDEAGGTSRQVAVQSTGLVFKGLILPGNDIDKTYDYTEGAAILEDLPSEMAGNAIRYIPEEVVDALLASKHHLPRYGDGKDGTSTKTPLKFTPGTTVSQKESEITGKEDNYSYDYPTLYMFQGSLYAGFKTVVKAAQQYDGPGGLMYNAVNTTLNHWYARLEDLKDKETTPGALDGTVTFVYMSEPPVNDDDNHYLQLNVEIYNKIVNADEPGLNNNEPIVTDDLRYFYADQFTIRHGEKNVNDVNENAKSFRELLTSGSDASRFTLYDASNEEVERGGAGWGYYCYYFWWLKHNDNGIDGRMGPMEFATVRNNVYKVTVDKITALGHSLNTLNDPDPLNPETPDEDDKIYIDVTMKVVPWVVRKNSATF